MRKMSENKRQYILIILPQNFTQASVTQQNSVVKFVSALILTDFKCLWVKFS